MNAKTEERLAAYLAEPELRQRFLDDAEAFSGEPEERLRDGLYLLIPIDHDLQLCVEGMKKKAAPMGAARGLS